eukprot:GHVS01100489.1.p1 GENE.GHVS01100489.1~~GHVS01100489.1.p1  ORF type:complete len:288 (+),score=59.01 GHVS01100489.1:1021-1884(+)
MNSKALQMLANPDLKMFCQRMTEEEFQALMKMLNDNMKKLFEDEVNFAVVALMDKQQFETTQHENQSNTTVASSSSSGGNSGSHSEVNASHHNLSKVQKVTAEDFTKMQSEVILKLKEGLMSNIALEDMAELHEDMELIRMRSIRGEKRVLEHQDPILSKDEYANYIVKEYLCSWQDDSILSSVDAITEMDHEVVRHHMCWLFASLDGKVLVRGNVDDIPTGGGVRPLACVCLNRAWMRTTCGYTAMSYWWYLIQKRRGKKDAGNGGWLRAAQRRRRHRKRRNPVVL